MAKPLALDEATPTSSPADLIAALRSSYQSFLREFKALSAHEVDELMAGLCRLRRILLSKFDSDLGDVDEFRTASVSG